ncbi:MAG: hypothetical protein ISR96_12545 [Nitrospira sp.]|nr:hypothetical protein [bacterium]MBL7050334.1 hypothetical protein [Nitrospira sp.]
MRSLSENFMNDLLAVDGTLHPILERVKQDHTLMFSIRKDYFNVYYRGGNILRVKAQSNGSYSAFFDNEYNKSGLPSPVVPEVIESPHASSLWVELIPTLKGIMDFYFSKYSKPEREFQQLVARENNFSNIANQSEYFISDIEFADSEIGARFDILALRWLASERKSITDCRPALIEMKYGDGALSGTSGVLKHLQDIDDLISNAQNYKKLLKTMETQFNQLDDLGLITFKRIADWAKIKLDLSKKPEVIFVLANHNPRSSKLIKILNDPAIEAYDNSPNFDLKFYVSSFAGYALHSHCMVSLTQFRELLKNRNV